MENASRALMMAAGALLTMLVLALLVFSWRRISDYYNKGDELKEIENLTNFNLQFTNFENRDVYGYELVSLANKVANYNMRYSNLDEAKNDEKYNSITMKFKISRNQVESLRFKNSLSVPYVTAVGSLGSKDVRDLDLRLFTKNDGEYIQSSTKNDILTLLGEANEIEEVFKGTSTATKLAKSINSLILTKEQLEYNEENRHWSYYSSFLSAIETYNKIVGTKDPIDIGGRTNKDIAKAYNDMMDKIIYSNSIMKYYEYYQFKNAIFRCTDITYNDVTDRVETITFDFQGIQN